MTQDEILSLTLDKLTDMWLEDTKFDYDEGLGEDVAGVSGLHAKYLKILYIHNQKHREASQASARVRQIRRTYYYGTIDQETEKKYGWTPFTYSVGKNDIDRFLDADEMVQKAETLRCKHEDIVEACKSIVKEIGNRGYQLKSAIDWKKFMAGLNL